MRMRKNEDQILKMTCTDSCDGLGFIPKTNFGSHFLFKEVSFASRKFAVKFLRETSYPWASCKFLHSRRNSKPRRLMTGKCLNSRLAGVYAYLVTLWKNVAICLQIPVMWQFQATWDILVYNASRILKTLTCEEFGQSSDLSEASFFNYKCLRNCLTRSGDL